VPTVKEDPAPAPNVIVVADRVAAPVQNRLTAEPVEKSIYGAVVLLKVTAPDKADRLKGPPAVLEIDPLMAIFPVKAVPEKAALVPSVMGHGIVIPVVVVIETLPAVPVAGVVVVMNAVASVVENVPPITKAEAPLELLVKPAGIVPKETPAASTKRDVPVNVELFVRAAWKAKAALFVMIVKGFAELLVTAPLNVSDGLP